MWDIEYPQQDRKSTHLSFGAANARTTGAFFSGQDQLFRTLWFGDYTFAVISS